MKKYIKYHFKMLILFIKLIEPINDSFPRSYKSAE